MTDVDRTAYRLFSEGEEDLLVECSSCGRVLKVRRALSKPAAEGYTIEGGIPCPCGKRAELISRSAPKGPARPTVKRRRNDDVVRCSKCGSEQISSGTKGFGLGKAAAGGVLFGPVGLLGGLLGSKKVTVTCLKCGHTWRPGKR